jgi:hypothetical protein
VQKYCWKALNAINHSMQNGFASLSNYQLHGTIAAGDGIVFRMIMPTNEEVEGEVTACFTHKRYYAYGLQVEYLINSLLFTNSCNKFYSFLFSPFCALLVLTASVL